MADHWKSFRPRRLSFDERHLRRVRLFGAALAFLCALSAVPSAAFSQEIGLSRGEASLDSGKYEDAVRQLSATVNDSDSTVAQASKALYMRGIAYRKLGFPGRAVADLGAAVWLGLGPSDKARALVNKGLAFREAGLASQAEAALAQARKASSAGEVQRLIAQDSSARAVASSSIDDAGPSESVWSRIVPSFGSDSSEPAPATAPASTPEAAPAPAPTQTAEAAPATGWNASVDDETAEQSGNAVSRWFGSLTGSSASTATQTAPIATSPTPTPPPAPRTATSASTATRTAAVPPPSAESWAANTETVSENESGTAVGRWFSRRTSSSPAPAPAAAPAPQGGGYTVQLANSRSQSEAQALWKKAKGANPQLASASPRIETVDIGDFGTFYTVKIGPFASQAEGAKACNALKRGGTDCSVISPDGP